MKTAEETPKKEPTLLDNIITSHTTYITKNINKIIEAELYNNNIEAKKIFNDNINSCIRTAIILDGLIGTMKHEATLLNQHDELLKTLRWKYINENKDKAIQREYDKNKLTNKA